MNKAGLVQMNVTDRLVAAGQQLHHNHAHTPSDLGHRPRPHDL